MKVFHRLVIKFVIFVFVVVLFSGIAYVIHSYPQSSPESALEAYLTLITENNIEKAYEMLDQSESTELSQEEYETAILAGKYALYESWQIGEVSERQGTGGESYVDYQVEFLNSSGEVQLESDFTVKKYSDAVLGLMDQWKVLSGHCMITDLRITVPEGSTLYLDGEEAAVSWKSADGIVNSKTCYVIPDLLPETISVVLRHPILESLNTTMDPSDGDVDYCDQMVLKESAEAACEELAVTALKKIYAAAVKQETDSLETVFENCVEEAVEAAENQMEEFDQEDAEFESVGIYDFDAIFEDPVYTDETNGAITTEMTFTYHYIVRTEVTVETGEVWADGTMAEEVQSISATGEAEAAFTMAYYDDEWHVASVSLPVIPE